MLVIFQGTSYYVYHVFTVVTSSFTPTCVLFLAFVASSARVLFGVYHVVIVMDLKKTCSEALVSGYLSYVFRVQNGLKQDALLLLPVIFALDSALGSAEKPAGTELIGIHELLVYAIDVNYCTSVVHIKELTINKQRILCIFSCFIARIKKKVVI
jgi:hypothetical protein